MSVHQWIRSAIRDSQQPTSSLGFLFLKLLPPPCAVLLVWTSLFPFKELLLPTILNSSSRNLGLPQRPCACLGSDISKEHVTASELFGRLPTSHRLQTNDASLFRGENDLSDGLITTEGLRYIHETIFSYFFYHIWNAYTMFIPCSTIPFLDIFMCVLHRQRTKVSPVDPWAWQGLMYPFSEESTDFSIYWAKTVCAKLLLVELPPWHVAPTQES